MKPFAIFIYRIYYLPYYQNNSAILRLGNYLTQLIENIEDLGTHIFLSLKRNLISYARSVFLIKGV